LERVDRLVWVCAARLEKLKLEVEKRPLNFSRPEGDQITIVLTWIFAL